VKPWIGVDLDGTLARYDGWTAWNVFGPPIPAMVDRIKDWRKGGVEVRIVTARVFPYIHGMTVPRGTTQCAMTEVFFTTQAMINAIQDWTEQHVGERLPVTCAKDYGMIELWDDRAVQVVPNTGRTLSEEQEAVLSALKGKAFRS
jgi:hypothetical protein